MPYGISLKKEKNIYFFPTYPSGNYKRKKVILIRFIQLFVQIRYNRKFTLGLRHNEHLKAHNVMFGVCQDFLLSCAPTGQRGDAYEALRLLSENNLWI